MLITFILLSEKKVQHKTNNRKYTHKKKNLKMSTLSVRGIPWRSFCEERWRFLSFRFYPLTAAVPAVLLAVSGFYYSGSGLTSDDEVTCYFCQQKYRGWQRGDNVDVIHRTLCPTCPMVTGGASANIPMTNLADVQNPPTEERNETTSINEDIVETDSRSESLHSESLETVTTPPTPISRPTASSATSSTCITASEVPDRPAPSVLVSQPSPASNGNNNSGKPLTYSDLAIITEQPKKPEYRIRSTRRQTFSDWPSQHHLSVDDLSDAGFYFAGYGDCARCFFCGGGLRNWDLHDNVWVEHARWFPRCGFMKQAKGGRFISAVKKLHDQGREVISYSDVMVEMEAASEVRSLATDPAVVSVVEVTGHDLQEVVKVAESVAQRQGVEGGDLSSEDVWGALVETHGLESRHDDVKEMVDREEVLEENISEVRTRVQELRREIRCKVCLVREVAVIFLPCGHFVTCDQCASACDRCTVCRQDIRGVVRASCH